MTTDLQATPSPMDPMRKTAFVAGALYLITFVTSIPALALYHGVLNDRSYVLHAGSTSGVRFGAFMEVILALTGIGTAVTLYPVVKRTSERAALGFVVSRVVEAAMILVGVLSVLSIVTLRHDATGATGAHAASLVGTSRSLVALHDWTFLLGPGVMPGVNALFLGTALYRSRLVPRVLPTIGLIGAPLLLAGATGIMFGLFKQISPVSGLSSALIAAWELSLGVWLVIKGFTPAPATSNRTPAPAPDRDAELAPAIG